MDFKKEYRKLLEAVKKERKKAGLPARNEDIAEILGYNRAYLSALIGQSGNVTADHLKTIKLHFPDMLGNVTNGQEEAKKASGYVPAEDMIAVLKEQNEFLRRNFETSLESIVEGQQQTGIQLKALSWFSALAAAGGDEKKAQESMLAIGNRIAAYEGIVGGEGNSEKVDTRNTGGGRQQKRK